MRMAARDRWLPTAFDKASPVGKRLLLLNN